MGCMEGVRTDEETVPKTVTAFQTSSGFDSLAFLSFNAAVLKCTAQLTVVRRSYPRALWNATGILPQPKRVRRLPRVLSDCRGEAVPVALSRRKSRVRIPSVAFGGDASWVRLLTVNQARLASLRVRLPVPPLPRKLTDKTERLRISQCGFNSHRGYYV